MAELDDPGDAEALEAAINNVTLILDFLFVL